jgi:hypothetical protein
MKLKLLQIQSELNAPKTQFNKFGNYYYRNHEDQCNALKPLLKQYNCTLIVSDEVKDIGGSLVCEATSALYCTDTNKLIGASKGYAGIDTTKKGMVMEMCFASASSFARKYSINGLFLCDDNKDADTTHKFDDKPTTEKSPDETEEDEWI